MIVFFKSDELIQTSKDKVKLAKYTLSECRVIDSNELTLEADVGGTTLGTVLHRLYITHCSYRAGTFVNY